jgi:hypothetical protein
MISRGSARWTVLSAQSNLVCPARRHQHVLAEPPVAGVDYEIANRPGCIVDDEIIDVADPAVAAFGLIPNELANAPQMGIACLSIAVLFGSLRGSQWPRWKVRLDQSTCRKPTGEMSTRCGPCQNPPVSTTRYRMAHLSSSTKKSQTLPTSPSVRSRDRPAALSSFAASWPPLERRCVVAVDRAGGTPRLTSSIGREARAACTTPKQTARTSNVHHARPARAQS